MVALTGAGISAASGIPTFRGKGGLYKNLHAQDLATPEAFARDPATVWEWYGWRRDLVRRARPNAAHRALRELSELVGRLDIITQNVDGLHEQTGLAGEGGIVRLHGSLWRMRCTRCGREVEDRSAGPYPPDLPHCSCGGLMRPAVVWFGEQLASEDLDEAGALTRHADVFLVVGTSAVVYPAAGFLGLASQQGAFVAEFNLEAAASGPEIGLRVTGPSEETLPALVDAVRKRRKV